jgi:hypothetical protein
VHGVANEEKLNHAVGDRIIRENVASVRVYCINIFDRSKNCISTMSQGSRTKTEELEVGGVQLSLYWAAVSRCVL